MKKMRLRRPYEHVVRDFYIDPATKIPATQRTGSKEYPFKSHRELKAAFEQMRRTEDEAQQAQLKAKREEAERSTREWTDRMAKEESDRLEKTEADRQAREAERKTKEKELDDKIAMLEVELTSLEKTYLETQHLFELAQLELMSFLARSDDERKQNHAEAKALAQQLHLLRMALMERSHEHDALVERRKGSQWNPWTILGGMATYALLGAAAYALFRGPEKSK